MVGFMDVFAFIGKQSLIAVDTKHQRCKYTYIDSPRLLAFGLGSVCYIHLI